MAEITSTSTQQGSRQSQAYKKRSTKIDMTPMVDLAFLLLTFFILTSALQKPNVMEVAMPDPHGGSAPVDAANALNLVLGKNDKIFWWVASEERPNVTNYSRQGVRRVLLEQVSANPRLIVLIKPQDNSRYENVVDILDEMEITGIKRFAIVDLAPEDKVLLREHSVIRELPKD